MNVVDEHTISFPASDLTPADMYLLLRDSVVPRPIAWVSTVDDEGRTNLAPFSFFNVCSPSPPVLGFSCGPRGDTHNDTRRTLKDTERNIRTTGEFVVNIAPESMLDAMVKSSDALPHGDSEFTHAGIPEAASTIIRPPRISGIPVVYECRCHSITELGTNSWIMGSVVHVHIDRSVYSANAKAVRTASICFTLLTRGRSAAWVVPTTCDCVTSRHTCGSPDRTCSSPHPHAALAAASVDSLVALLRSDRSRATHRIRHDGQPGRPPARLARGQTTASTRPVRHHARAPLLESPAQRVALSGVVCGTARGGPHRMAGPGVVGPRCRHRPCRCLCVHRCPPPRRPIAWSVTHVAPHPHRRVDARRVAGPE